MTLTAKIILACCVGILLLHVWGAVQPVHANWGVHFFGFFPGLISLAALAILLVAAIPGAQQRCLSAIEWLLRQLSRLPLLVGFIIAGGILYGAIRLLPVKMHLLGDGAILLRSVQFGITGKEITASFNNQPLMFWIYRWAYNLHPPEALPDPYGIYYSIDIIAAALFLLLLFWTARMLPRPPVERFLLACFLLFGGGSQFFFGYVENYVLLYVATAAYAITGWFALERKIAFAVPVCCLVLMVLLHLGALVYLPSAALLVFFRWGKSRKQAAVILGAMAVVGVIVLYALGFNIVNITRHLASGSVDFLQPFSSVGGNFPYPMFSSIHLLDWLNSSLLVAPCGLILSAVLPFALPSEGRWRRPALLFLVTVAACGIFFTWVINSALGLARDWDLYSSFFVPLMILPIYLFTQPLDLSPRRYVLAIAVVITLLHFSAWIGVNASADLHLARVERLDDPRFLSLTTRLSYDEALANFFFDSGQYARARKFYEDFIIIDSTNPRIIGNIADVYRHLGERDKYFRMLLRAVDLNTPDPGVYSNLGVEYATRGDTTKAITFNERAIELNPSMAKAHANLGLLYTAKKQYVLADQYFATALNLGMRDPNLFRYAGDVKVYLGDYRRAIEYYDNALAMNPSDQRLRTLRDRIYAALRGEGQK